MAAILMQEWGEGGSGTGGEKGREEGYSLTIIVSERWVTHMQCVPFWLPCMYVCVYIIIIIYVRYVTYMYDLFL